MFSFNDDYCRVWVGNLSDKITDELLYELFLQAGPLDDIVLPKYPDGRPKSFAFITFKHRCSVMYCKELFKGTTLFGKEILIEPKVSEMSNDDMNNEGLVSLESLSDFNGGASKVMETPDKNIRGSVGLNSLRGFSGGTAMKGRDDLSKPFNKTTDFSNPSNRGGDTLPQRKSGVLENGSLPDFDMLLQMAQQLQNPYGSSMNLGFSSPAVFPSQSKDSVINNNSRENSRGRDNYHSHGRDRDRDYGRSGHEKSHPYRDTRRDDRRHGYFSSRNQSSRSHHRDRK